MYALQTHKHSCFIYLIFNHPHNTLFHLNIRIGVGAEAKVLAPCIVNEMRTYPVVVRESAPITNPPSNSQATMVFCNKIKPHKINFFYLYTNSSKSHNNRNRYKIHGNLPPWPPSNVMQSSSPACLEWPVSSTNWPSLRSKTTNPLILIIQVLRC
jgi:hypothetical protein